MNNDYDAVMKKLIKTTMRMFYEPHHIVIADILLENIILSDSEFCQRMKILNKEFNKLIVRMKDDHLIKYDIKVEVQDDGKQLLRTVYFFNYAEVKDIVKYKIFKMAKILEDRARVSEDNFYCKPCERVYSALDAQSCMDDYTLKCTFCKSELEEHHVAAEGEEVGLKELMGSLEELIVILKEVDNYKIPTLDYFQVLEIKRAKESEAAAKKPSSETKEVEPKVIFNERAEGDGEDSGVDNFEETKEEKNADSVSALSAKNNEMVHVNGVPKKFSDVTDDDREAMNEEEYTRYFEIYEKYNS